MNEWVFTLSGDGRKYFIFWSAIKRSLQIIYRNLQIFGVCIKFARETDLDCLSVAADLLPVAVGVPDLPPPVPEPLLPGASLWVHTHLRNLARTVAHTGGLFVKTFSLHVSTCWNFISIFEFKLTKYLNSLKESLPWSWHQTDTWLQGVRRAELEHCLPVLLHLVHCLPVLPHLALSKFSEQRLVKC